MVCRHDGGRSSGRYFLPTISINRLSKFWSSVMLKKFFAFFTWLLAMVSSIFGIWLGLYIFNLPLITCMFLGAGFFMFTIMAMFKITGAEADTVAEIAERKRLHG
jgi:apolipoprotein N-acyltransferase